jgi:hypothetical protein
LAPDLGELKNCVSRIVCVCVCVCVHIRVYAEWSKREHGRWKYNIKHVICAQITCQVRDDFDETWPFMETTSLIYLAPVPKEELLSSFSRHVLNVSKWRMQIIAYVSIRNHKMKQITAINHFTSPHCIYH